MVISCCDWSREQGARWSPSIIDGASSGGDVSLSDSFSQFIALAFRHLCWSRVWVCACRVVSPKDGVDIAGTLALCTGVGVMTVRGGCLYRSVVVWKRRWGHCWNSYTVPCGSLVTAKWLSVQELGVGVWKRRWGHCWNSYIVRG